MKDSIVESVRQDLLDRSEVGIKKYNTTLDRNDLETEEWVQHAYEELLDGALYLKRLLRDINTPKIYYSSESYFTLMSEKSKLELELDTKNRIINNLTKVIKSQEEEIAELKKEEYLDKKRRAWHY
jgi:hypothetical protein